MSYLIGLLAALSLFWLGLSGHYSFPILHMGIFSLVFTIWFVGRLKLFDQETSPYWFIPRLLGYWIWLLGEILKANLVVVRAAIRAEPDIEPLLTRVKTNCKSDLAKVVFANSITLTPGTVTVDIDGDEMLVHALYASDAAPGAFDEMDSRVKRAVDGKN
mgnify:CR=1 FL=1